ncbi:MAG TPA: A/G-specific adenine glycosylase [Candidatus Angelobacter sp.]
MTTTLLSAHARRQFRRQLLRWFDREKRTLPWRGETDPYRILVSEVMLQQTRVTVVKERYNKFLQQFPSVLRLAAAREESVLAAWSGLGYYRRARALHAAAKSVRKNRAFPHSAAQLLQLPGIGRYTAAAVASIAFGEPVAVVDGNVKRVLQRLSGRELSPDAHWHAAQDLLEERQPGDFNQAMMELGATVCLPGQPLCTRCPVSRFCASRGASGKSVSSPQARKKATLSYLLAQKEDGTVFLRQRSPDVSLMPGMWELPLLRNKPADSRHPVLKLRHSITTTDYSILVFSSSRARLDAGVWVTLSSAHRLPLTGLTRKILGKLGVF